MSERASERTDGRAGALFQRPGIASFQFYKHPLIKGSRVTVVKAFYFSYSPRRNGVISCKISCAVFNEPKLERSIGASNRKNASTKYIGRAVFCPFLRQIAPPYVPRFHFPIA